MILVMENLQVTFSKTGRDHALRLSASLSQKVLQKTGINILSRLEKSRMKSDLSMCAIGPFLSRSSYKE